jgi:hypothetical protein
MTYGHAERNLAFIRQLEAETRQLPVRSAVGHVPHLTSTRRATMRSRPRSVRPYRIWTGSRHEGHEELPRGLAREKAAAESFISGGTWLEKTAEFLPRDPQPRQPCHLERVRIGGEAVVMPGVTIGDGAIIAARARSHLGCRPVPRGRRQSCQAPKKPHSNEEHRPVAAPRGGCALRSKDAPNILYGPLGT